MGPKIYMNGHCRILLYYPQLHTSDLLVTYPAVFTWSYTPGNLCSPLQVFAGIVKFTIMVVAYSLEVLCIRIYLYTWISKFTWNLLLYMVMYSDIQRALLLMYLRSRSRYRHLSNPESSARLLASLTSGRVHNHQKDKCTVFLINSQCLKPRIV